METIFMELIIIQIYISSMLRINKIQKLEVQYKEYLQMLLLLKTMSISMYNICMKKKIILKDMI